MRLIDADRALEIVRNQGIAHPNAYHLTNYATLILREAPTVDAVEVVRCRECKQGEVDDPDFPDEYYCHAGCGWNNGDFYCSYGEKRRDKACNICKYAGRPTYKSPCSECKEFSKYEYENKKTNADIIRSMSDEELADMLWETGRNYRAICVDPVVDYNEQHEHLIDWLKNPAE